MVLVTAGTQAMIQAWGMALRTGRWASGSVAAARWRNTRGQSAGWHHASLHSNNIPPIGSDRFIPCRHRGPLSRNGRRPPQTRARPRHCLAIVHTNDAAIPEDRAVSIEIAHDIGRHGRNRSVSRAKNLHADCKLRAGRALPAAQRRGPFPTMAGLPVDAAPGNHDRAGRSPAGMARDSVVHSRLISGDRDRARLYAPCIYTPAPPKTSVDPRDSPPHPPTIT